MSGLTSIMSIAKSGLTTAQAAINVTGQNIANVDTEGYSRQSVTFAEAYVISTAGGTVGTGVWAEGIQRHRTQVQPFAFEHHGRWLRAASLPVPGAGREAWPGPGVGIAPPTRPARARQQR